MRKFVYVLALISKWIYNPEWTCSVSRCMDIYKNTSLPFNPLVVHPKYAIVKLKKYPQTCVVAHRGTDTFEDLEIDVTSQLYDKCYQNSFVSSFQAGYFEFSKNIYNSMEYLLETNTCKRFISTGHSLGGSYAIITGDMYKHPIVTFGAPKTCCYNKEIENLHRYVNYMDPIPMLPFHDDITDCGGTTYELMKNYLKMYYKDNKVDNKHMYLLRKHHINNYLKKIKNI